VPLLLQRVRSGGHSRAPEAPSSGGSGSRRPRPVYPRIDPAVIVAVRCVGSCPFAGLVACLDGNAVCSYRWTALQGGCCCGEQQC
jgi:hypothetical protein